MNYQKVDFFRRNPGHGELDQDDWGDIFMKQPVNKCRQINFWIFVDFISIYLGHEYKLLFLYTYTPWMSTVPFVWFPEHILYLGCAVIT